MRIVKKLALVLVASAFVAGGLAGCGEKKADAPKPADAPKEAPKDAPK